MSKIKLQIKNRWTGFVIFEYEKEDNVMKDTVLQAIASGADLRDADLIDANLSGADLSGADLRDANLSGADLSGADLRDADPIGANLSDANLSGADLRSADLRSADLQGADLRSADLRSAYLSGADLRSANLRSAYLRSANLRSADLQGADLQGADLQGADLQGADLRSADLRSADLTPIKNDMFIVLLHAIPEIGALKKALLDGKIDGSVYDGDCKCLNGTLCYAAAYGEKNRVLSVRSSQRPIERFFLGIKPGDTPENNQFAKLAMEWIEYFEALIATK